MSGFVHKGFHNLDLLLVSPWERVSSFFFLYSRKVDSTQPVVDVRFDFFLLSASQHAEVAELMSNLFFGIHAAFFWKITHFIVVRG